MKQVRVMTFNIRHGRGMDDEINLPRIADVIRESGADVVALNEVDCLTRRCGGVDQVQELGQLLGMHAEYSPSIPYQGGQYGNGVLSRLPMGQVRVHQLPKLGREVRSLIHAPIEWEDETLHFYATHLGLGDDEQRGQLRAIAKLLEETSGPKILAGDFNFDVAQVDLMTELPTTMREVWTLQKESGLTPNELSGNTFPADAPVKRIDYVVVSEELRISEPFIPVETLASDHLPLVGTLERVR